MQNINKEDRDNFMEEYYLKMIAQYKEQIKELKQE